MSAANDAPFGVMIAAFGAAIVAFLFIGVLGGRFVDEFSPNYSYLVIPVCFVVSAVIGVLIGIGTNRRIERSKKNGTFMPIPW